MIRYITNLAIRESRRRRWIRRGLTLIFTIALMALALAMAASFSLILTARHRLDRTLRVNIQMNWAIEAALERTTLKLIRDETSAGETWHVLRSEDAAMDSPRENKWITKSSVQIVDENHRRVRIVLFAENEANQMLEREFYGLVPKADPKLK